MREYARIREVAEGDARPLRQLSIMQYVVEEVPLEESKKKNRTVVDAVLGTAPPIGSWQPSLGGWGRVTWSGGVPYVPPCAPLTPVRQRRGGENNLVTSNYETHDPNGQFSALAQI